VDILQKKDKIIFILIVILAFLIGNNGIYKFYLRKINSVKSQIEKEKKKNELLEIVGILDSKLQTYQIRSLAETEITQLADKISAMAKRAGVEIENFNPGPTVNTEQYVELSLIVALRCGFHKLGKLVSLIESSQEFMRVKELKIQRPAFFSPRASRIPQVNLTISGLYLKK
jgi:Tfp pilus assembly protein PilO